MLVALGKRNESTLTTQWFLWLLLWKEPLHTEKKMNQSKSMQYSLVKRLKCFRYPVDTAGDDASLPYPLWSQGGWLSRLHWGWLSTAASQSHMTSFIGQQPHTKITVGGSLLLTRLWVDTALTRFKTTSPVFLFICPNGVRVRCRTSSGMSSHICHGTVQNYSDFCCYFFCKCQYFWAPHRYCEGKLMRYICICATDVFGSFLTDYAYTRCGIRTLPKAIFCWSWEDYYVNWWASWT